MAESLVRGCVRRGGGRKHRSYPYDAGGLGTGHRVNYFAPSEIVKAFNLPDNEQLVLLLPLGYAAEGATPAPLHDASRDLKEMVQYL